jgi:hypothetical protein
MLEKPKVPVRVVVCAANRSELGIVPSARHFDERMVQIIHILHAYYNGECSKISVQWEQGFIDQFGVFMNRTEALAVATAAGQINLRRPKTQPEDMLFSEDLY